MPATSFSRNGRLNPRGGDPDEIHNVRDYYLAFSIYVPSVHPFFISIPQCSLTKALPSAEHK
ncbi:hypothetical protein BFAG_00680 [Bacteroides fragilis 3_1_12]|uniref:Uncharacterized protein n=1 Tax=Bacteroides fragilis 3_1_12 TaxID=457424 RepID=A0ABN0BGS7_BACFG|nr:hypothetical protein BFAG_00680 [Bacteroides fragilis 3_1_12]